MSESGVPYKKRQATPDEVGVPPTPNISEPHLEIPPPNVTIPAPDDQTQVLCKICGRALSSKEELQLHMTLDHAKKVT
jgi:hypothetical protein